MSLHHLYLLALCCLPPLCPAFLLGQAADTLVPPPSTPTPVEEPGYYRIAEYMPLLRQCTAQYLSDTEQKECTSETVMKLVYENLRWPGPDVCVEGMAVVSFIVEKDGTLIDFAVRRDPGQGTGEEALRAVKLMAEAAGTWVPGTWGAKRNPVRIQYNIPVRYRLD
jgi:protein TonB